MLDISKKQLLGITQNKLRNIFELKGMKDYAVVEGLPFVVNSSTAEVFGISLEGAISGTDDLEKLLVPLGDSVKTPTGGVYLSSGNCDVNSWEFIHADDGRWYPLGRETFMACE